MIDQKKLVLTMLFIITVLGSVIQSRKYDIEDEALKLYGEDLKSVIKRFRRTPDYLKILKDKMEELKAHLNDVAIQTLYHFSNKLADKCKAMYPQPKDESSTPGGMDGTLLRERPEIIVNQFPIPDSLLLRTRKVQEERKTPVEALDSYPMLSSSLTLHERNMFRDIGFEYARKMVDSLIKSMGSDDLTLKSTKLPYGGTEKYYKYSAPEVASRHELVMTVAPEYVTEDTFKYKLRAPKVARQYS